MQLGARWRAGEAPHSGVPELLYAAISEAESQHPDGDSWTLTWLEGRPRVELLTQSGVVRADLRVDSRDNVVSSPPLSDPTGNGAPTVAGTADSTDDDDDDDWLN